MKTYFVTGGAGFIGSSLVSELLKKGNKVVVIDNFCDFYNPEIKEKNISEFNGNESFKLYRGDIRDRELLNKMVDLIKILSNFLTLCFLFDISI